MIDDDEERAAITQRARDTLEQLAEAERRQRVPQSQHGPADERDNDFIPPPDPRDRRAWNAWLDAVAPEAEPPARAAQPMPVKPKVRKPMDEQHNAAWDARCRAIVREEIERSAKMQQDAIGRALASYVTERLAALTDRLEKKLNDLHDCHERELAELRRNDDICELPNWRQHHDDQRTN